METRDFYEGMKTEGDLDKEHVDAAEHFIRLKKQVAPSSPQEDLPEVEKLASLPAATLGDTSPRVYNDPEGQPRVGWDSRKGYNVTALHHEGKHHTLIDHHSSGRVGHFVSDPQSGQFEHVEVHPSHKHMTDRFHEHARVMHQHLNQAMSPVKTAMRRLGMHVAVKTANTSAGAPVPIKPVQPIGGGLPAKTPSIPGPAGGGGAGGMPKTSGIKETLLSPRAIGTAAGALLLGGGTYLASRPRKDLGGKSTSEVKLEGTVRGQRAEGEEHAGFAKKLKNRLNEFDHGLAKVFRQHPVKGALVSAANGAAVGNLAARALGG